MSGRNSGKQLASSRGSIPHNPTSLNPGVSTRYPPSKGSIRADTVVFRPRRSLALSSPVRSVSPGWSAFSRLDFPAPEGPVTTDSRPAMAARSSASPAPVLALVRNTG